MTRWIRVVSVLASVWMCSMGGISTALAQKSGPKCLTFARDNRAYLAKDDSRRFDPVQLNIGQELHVLLPVIEGTGATWIFREGTHLLVKDTKGGGENPPPGEQTSTPGGSENRLFRFHAVNPGSGSLKLVYTLPNGQGGPVFFVPIVVK